MANKVDMDDINFLKEITICGYTCTPAGCSFLLIYTKVLQLVAKVVVLAS